LIDKISFMVSDKIQIKNKIAEFLRERDEVIFAYIFGSFVGKEYYHDIDVAVYLSDNFNKDDLMEFPYGYESSLIAELMKLLHTDKIDLVILNNAPLLITNRIVNTGMLLFDKDKFNRISFENKSRKMFIDTENLRNIKTHYLVKKIKQYA